MSTLGHRLKAARIAARLTQLELAQRSGITQQGVNKIEKDRVAKPSYETIAALAKSLAITPDALTGEDSQTSGIHVDPMSSRRKTANPTTWMAYHCDMKARVKQLETDVSAIRETLKTVERDVAVIKSNYATRADIMATKADIAEAKNSIIMWVVSAILLAQLLPSLLKKFGL